MVGRRAPGCRDRLRRRCDDQRYRGALLQPELDRRNPDRMFLRPTDAEGSDGHVTLFARR
jgi:hypothetical protein